MNINQIKKRVMNKVSREVEARNKGFEFETEIIGSCNLNCWGCNHFSPLVEGQAIDIESFGDDVKRISVLFKNDVKRFKILGGEPLLHPAINDFIVMARGFLPEAEIQIITNGLLLPKMKRSFWNVCRENRIIINITPYPVSFDYERCISYVKHNKVKCIVFYQEGDRIQRKFPLDVSGGQEIEWSFEHCWGSRGCNTLKNGRLYCCTVAPYIDRFNAYFGYNLVSDSRDSINIYDVNSASEIIDFLSKPIPFCRYCKVERRNIDEYKWQISSRSEDEWT